MDSNLLELFKNYNTLLQRHDKAIKYFQMNPDKLEQYLPKLKDVTEELSRTIVKIKESGYPMSHEEVIEGFKQIKYLGL